MKRRIPGFFFFLSLILLTFSFQAVPLAGIVINELYYDHPGADAGWEYVELYNPGPARADLSLYSLEFVDGATGASRLLWRGAAGGVLESGERLLVCGGYVTVPGEPLLGSIENGPDAVRLILGSATADIVGYGDTPYCECDPAPDAAAGLSLSRKPDGYDSGSNAVDFVPSGPTPGSPNFFACDLELALREAPLPCGGEPYTVEFLLVNRGLERFAGRVGIAASGGEDVGERLVEVDTAPSDTAVVPLEMPVARQTRFSLEARIESSIDENGGNDTLSVQIVPSPGDVVVSEIMYRPASGGSEWLELACRSAAEVSLSGWRLSDATGTRRLVSSKDLAIVPGTYVVLAGDSALFTRDHPFCPAAIVEPEGGLPWLNDVGDEVILYDGEDRVVERVRYEDLLGGESGRSIERFSVDVCSSFPGGLWHRCSSTSGSTPGAANSIDLPGIPSPGNVEVAPNPFCPARDGVLRIWGMGAAGETGLLVRIFDIEGAEIARIFGEREGARAFGCAWNGKGTGGGDSPTGLYVCVVEFTKRGGGVCRREKLCVALYR